MNRSSWWISLLGMTIGLITIHAFEYFSGNKIERFMSPEEYNVLVGSARHYLISCNKYPINFIATLSSSELIWLRDSSIYVETAELSTSHKLIILDYLMNTADQMPPINEIKKMVDLVSSTDNLDIVRNIVNTVHDMDRIAENPIAENQIVRRNI